MTNILMVIAPTNFRDEELLQPKEVFESNGFSVIITSIRTTQAKGMLGAVVKVDEDISDIYLPRLANDYDAVVFVGGSGVEEHKLYANPRMLELAKASASCKVLGAICLAPMILAAAGLLKGKQATVFASAAQFLRNKGVEYSEEPIVETENIITANGPEYAKTFAECIVDKLKEQKQ